MKQRPTLVDGVGHSAIGIGPSAVARVGISGWRYAPWRGVFYPSGLRQADELAFASRQLQTIELNGSFYSLQRPSSYARWREETPAGFVFSVKGGRYITHMLRLKDARQALANFFGSGVAALGPKLGPLLWQLPPSLKFDAGLVSEFLGLLPKTWGELSVLARESNRPPLLAAKDDSGSTAHDSSSHGLPAPVPLRHTLEPRHPSFDTADYYALLREHRVACCVADTAGKFPQLSQVTSNFVYVRLHGSTALYASGYRPKELAAWAERIRQWGSRGLDVYVYFDNDIKVHAPFDALNLERLLAGKPVRKKPRALGLLPDVPLRPWPMARV